MEQPLNRYTDARELDREAWKRFVENHPQGSVFQRPEMHDLFAATEGFEPVLAAVGEGPDRLQGLLLAVLQREPGWKGPFSARSVAWGAPLVAPDADPGEALAELIAAYEQALAGRALYSEFRNLSDTSAFRGLMAEHGYLYIEHLNYIIPLSSTVEEVYRLLHKKRRKQIRRAREAGLTVRELVEPAEMDKVYPLFAEMYRERLRRPVPGRGFFRSFVEILVKADLGRVFLVEQDGRTLGCQLSPITPGRTVYAWYLYSDYSSKLYPSVLANWAPMEWGCERGLSSFDFMGAGSPDQPYGVREFKAQFGGELVEYGRYRKIHRPLLYRFGALGFKLWTNLR